MGADDLVVIRTFVNKFEADVAKSALDASNIESLIRADDADGLQPGLWLAGVELLVREEDVQQAEEVLGKRE